ncbi:MAG: F0F1 ATP synthase subunit gamma [Bacteroides sp.]|nr:F0F1 ATP synthase subunit gamma [Bacteroides sp.]
MASLKEIKNRINSVKSTRQITSAMKMVSSAKLHKAQGMVENMLPYQQRLHAILNSLLASGLSVSSPYIETRKEVRRVAIVIFASNNSLCGTFNANIIKLLEQTLHRYAPLGAENILLYTVGKKVEEALRKSGRTLQASYSSMADKPQYASSTQLAQELMQAFVKQEIDQVELIYHHFKSVGTQVLTQETFLPLTLASIETHKTESSTPDTPFLNKDYIVEPSPEELLTQLIPKVLAQKLFTVSVDSHTSEHAARMLAMQAATDNANELIQELTKQYNKTRQQTITNELLDIVAGSMR